MRRIRNASFVVLCVAIIQTSAVAVYASCFAPGLIGYGATEHDAIAACENEQYADTLCEYYCGPGWTQTSMECGAWGEDPEWSAAGSAECEDTSG
jgi:hypothetical protein